MSIKYLVVCFCSVFILCNSACIGKKKLQKETNNAQKKAIEQLVKKVNDNTLQTEWLQAKLNIKATDSKQKQSFNADMRLRKDSALWISITPPFLKLEVARALITPDSVKIIDRFNKKYYAEGTAYLESLVNYPLDFNLLQDIIVGRTLVSPNDSSKLSETEGTYCLLTMLNNISYFTYCNAENFVIDNVTVSDSSAQRSLVAKLTNYKPLGEKQIPFSYQRNIVIKTPSVYTTDIKFMQVKTAGPFKLPFKVSKKYTRAVLGKQ